MQNIFIDEGNLGFDPSLKYVPVKTEGGTEQRAVVELNVRFDVKKYSTENDKYLDVSGFWGRVTMWGKRAEYAHAHLKKGCRVLVVGEISQHAYVVQKGERKGQDATSIEIEATHLGIVLLGVEQVVFAEKKTRHESIDGEGNTHRHESETGMDADDDGIPFGE